MLSVKKISIQITCVSQGQEQEKQQHLLAELMPSHQPTSLISSVEGSTNSDDITRLLQDEGNRNSAGSFDINYYFVI